MSEDLSERGRPKKVYEQQRGTCHLTGTALLLSGLRAVNTGKSRVA